MNPVLENLTQHIPGGKWHGDRYQVRCPNHDDKQASLSIGPANNGGAVMKCHADCDTSAIMARIGLSMSDLMPPKEQAPKDDKADWFRVRGNDIETPYYYTDAAGKKLYRAVRVEFQEKNSKTGATRPAKTFYQERPAREGEKGPQKNLTGVQRVLYRLPEVLKAVADGVTIWIPEGEKDVENLAALGLVATTNAMGAGAWKDEYSQSLTGANVVLLPDNDESGRKHANTVAPSLQAVGATVKVLALPGLPVKGDVSDWLAKGGTVEQLQVLADAAPLWTAPISKPLTADPPVFTEKPRPLTTDLLPVPKLSPDMLPQQLQGWAGDVAERLSCPPEYVASAAIVALASVLGRQVGIRPKRFDHWTVTPNLWGAVVGPPGVKKTPAVNEALKPVYKLQAETRKLHECEMENHELTQEIAKLKADGAKDRLKAEARKPGANDAVLRQMLLDSRAGCDEPAPIWRRFILNDATVEKTGELLGENPNGLLMFRDELTGFLNSLKKTGHETDRAFYLEAWNGNGPPFAYDRIGRGTVIIDNVCLSLFGTIQPGPLAKYLRSAGDEADGFMPRFQLMVYPDPPHEFKNVDRWPAPIAKNNAYTVFMRFADMEPESIGAEFDEEGRAYLHFSPDAQEAFNHWYEVNETRGLTQSDSPLILTHLSKYASLVPSLALIFHLAADGVGPVSLDALVLALRWAEFLEAHARRIYQSAMDGTPEDAINLAERIKHSFGQRLEHPFKMRDIVRKGWAGLSTLEDVERTFGILEDRGHAAIVPTAKGENGGRATELVFMHPDYLPENLK